MASEQVAPGSDVASGTQEKPSFIRKVKDKAKKLKSKLTHHDSHEGSPTSGDAHAPGPTDKDIDESDATESDGEGKVDDIPYTPLSTGLPQPSRPAGATDPKSEGSPFGAVTSGQSGYGTDTIKTDDKSFPQDPSLLKTDGSAGTEQAIPTNYNYFNSDPDKGNLPSGYDTSQRKQDIPSSLGGESAGLTPGTQNSLQNEEEFPGFTPSTDKDFDETSGISKDTTSSNPDLDDAGGANYGNVSAGKNQADHHQGHKGLEGAAAGAAGAGGVAAAVHHEFGSSKDQAPNNENDNSFESAKGDPDEREFQPADEFNQTGPAAFPASDSGNDGLNKDTSSFPPSQEQYLDQDNSGIGAGQYEQQSITSGKPTDSAYGLEDSKSGGTQFPSADEFNQTGSESLPISEPGNDGYSEDRSFPPSQEQDLDQTDSGIGNASAGKDQKDHHQGYRGLEAAGAGVAGAGGVAAAVHHEFGSSKNQAPVNNENEDSLESAKGDPDEREFQPADELNGRGSESFPASDSGNDGSNKNISSFPPSQVQDLDQDNSGIGAGQYEQQSITSGKPTDSGYGLEDSKSGGTQFPSADEFKQTGSQTLPISEPGNDGSSEDRSFQPSHEQDLDQSDQQQSTASANPIDSAYQGKDDVGNDAISSSYQAPSSDEKPTSEDVPEATSKANTVQNTNPDQDDKKGSASSVTGLTSLFASKLGLGGQSPASSPTSAPKDASANSTTASSDARDSTTEDAQQDHPSTAAPGLLDRVTGIASSFFGAAKQPAAEEGKTAQ